MSMQKIYIDISNLLEVSFVSGIQRVVKNVVFEFLAKVPERVELLAYHQATGKFEIINKAFFQAYFDSREPLFFKNRMNSGPLIDPSEMKPGDIFFDLDSVWSMAYRRSALLPRLKKYGVKTAVYVYDVIPTKYPQFCHPETVCRYLDYLGAYLQYGDYIITSTASVLEDVRALGKKLGIGEIKGGVSWLGSDFRESSQDETVEPKVIDALKGKTYILSVGTIEPRKNHAFLLDAFEKDLFAAGADLVFAGRGGWRTEGFQKRMKNSPYFGKQFFWFEGLNDATIDYLYSNAAALAFPTYDEGFGLPMIEAFERKTPVIATDIPVLREVGGDLADYFPLNDEKAFSEVVRKYLQEPRFASARRENLKNYVRYTWSDTADKILQLLEELKPAHLDMPQQVKQVFYLTARPDAVGAALEYVDAWMPFVQEVVLCCPDFMVQDMQNCYSGRLSLRILTDSQVLQGRPLPEDHQKRNTFLRICAMRLGVLDDVFIMSDDDYRPLRPIDLSVFLEGERYKAYYCYDLDLWYGAQRNLTSYDEGMMRTTAFLREHGYPLRQYSSHMPQIIDKRVYLEMVEKLPEVEEGGFDEWSTYFNYLTFHYPASVENKVYTTLAWPDEIRHWDIMYPPREYLFENFYDSMYDATKTTDQYSPVGLFSGMSTRYCESSLAESEEKIRRFRFQVDKHMRDKETYQAFCEHYAVEKGEYPSFVVEQNGGKFRLHTPKYIEIPVQSFLRIPVQFHWADPSRKKEITVFYSITDSHGEVSNMIEETMPADMTCYHMPVYGAWRSGKYTMNMTASAGSRKAHASIEVRMVKG